jgi:hypothetical protein
MGAGRAFVLESHSMKKLLALVALAACTAAMAQTTTPDRRRLAAEPAVHRPDAQHGFDAGQRAVLARAGFGSGAGSARMRGSRPAPARWTERPAPPAAWPAAAAPDGQRGHQRDVRRHAVGGRQPDARPLMTGGSLGGVTSGTMLGSSGSSMATTPSTMSQPSLASGRRRCARRE